jgi:hypothetical protein
MGVILSDFPSRRRFSSGQQAVGSGQFLRFDVILGE